MTLSRSGRQLIQGFEGLSLTAYPDAGGYSIGYGHFGASPGQTITAAQAEALFDQDLAKYDAAVSLAAPGGTQAQHDAMVSLAYNIGSAGFSSSTLAKKHAAGDYTGAAAEFPKWNKSQGAVNQTLVARREKERQYYLGVAPLGYVDPGPMSYVGPGPEPTAPPLPPGWDSMGRPRSGGVGILILFAGIAGAAWLALHR